MSLIANYQISQYFFLHFFDLPKMPIFQNIFPWALQPNILFLIWQKWPVLMDHFLAVWKFWEWFKVFKYTKTSADDSPFTFYMKFSKKSIKSIELISIEIFFNSRGSEFHFLRITSKYNFLGLGLIWVLQRGKIPIAL